ncbi:hypothetical protein EH31_12485 [Erythrobacter longus]|uniref:DUF2007 domain-containing protein n=1 Tax=Erythrobacter longus TaxID=1044 RepID=A0A074M476_ERYLO|nr:hypothetical protein [Erythrobacter longus]KEO89456.1 hypothetical protein EH31_12485 [Erythrobacter longus]
MTDLVTVSIAVSRAEALVVASMLEGYGIPVHIGGDRQGSTEYLSLAYGGYRLWISQDDHEVASQIIRQSGALDEGDQRKWPRRALVRFLLIWTGLKVAIVIGFSGASGVSPPLYALGFVMLESLTAPVNPQGRADYFLASPS